MESNRIKYFRIKNFIFLFYVLLTESIFWALVISPFTALNEFSQNGYLYDLFFGLFVFTVTFIWAKTLLELWVVFAITLIVSYKK